MRLRSGRSRATQPPTKIEYLTVGLGGEVHCPLGPTFMWLVLLATLITALNRPCPSNAIALPHIDVPPTTESTSSVFVHHADTRTTLNIIFSCISTLVLSMAYCIRPNIPPPATKSSFSLLRSKLTIAFWMLICPENVLYWAFCQWYHARTIAKKYAGKSVFNNSTAFRPELCD